MELPAKTTIETTVRINTQPENESRYWDEEYLRHDRAKALPEIGEAVVRRCVDCKVPKVKEPEFIGRTDRWVEVTCSKDLQPDDDAFSPCFVIDSTQELVDIASAILDEHIQ